MEQDTFACYDNIIYLPYLHFSAVSTNVFRYRHRPPPNHSLVKAKHGLSTTNYLTRVGWVSGTTGRSQNRWRCNHPNGCGGVINLIFTRTLAYRQRRPRIHRSFHFFYYYLLCIFIFYFFCNGFRYWNVDIFSPVAMFGAYLIILNFPKTRSASSCPLRRFAYM